jgi:hypothetical protein
MKCRIDRLGLDVLTKQQTLTILLDGDFRHRYDELKDKDLEVTFKPWRKKRSLNANAYCWELLGELSEAMNLPAEEIYRNAIKAVGIYKDFPPLPQAEANTLKTAWRQLGIGWIADQLDYDEDGSRVVVRCYYGSSVYNTRQMSRLVDYIVQDCKALGIETKTPEELAYLKEQWKGADIDV